jgi:hypothetical protein
MKTISRLLWLLSGFALALGTLYWFLTYEATGAVLLWVLGLMPLIIASWIWRHGLVGARLAEDESEADPGARAGEVVGSFPLVSAWPIFAVLGVIAAGASLVYGLILLVPGFALLAYAIFGFMRESRN